jgi:cell wall-associated NlpC family hydrolase
MKKQHTIMPRTSRWAATTVGLAAVAGLALPAVPAQAKPAPSSLSAAKKQLAQLNDQVDQLGNQYNKAIENWKAAKRRLGALGSSVTAERKTFADLHVRVAQLAAAAYKSGDSGTLPDLVSAKDPQSVLDQMAAFTQVSNNRAAELTQFLASAQRLERQQALAQQAAEQLAEKKAQLDKQKTQAHTAIQKQLKLIDRLGANIDPGSSKTNCSILASGKAEAVLKFACAQLGKSYVFGGAGPNVWDCSGLTMVAYKHVGINMGHYVPDQWSASRRVPKSELQPGDLVFFHDLGHEGIYVGQGKFIQAPHTGDVVKISSLSDAWYSSVYVGAGRLL